MDCASDICLLFSIQRHAVDSIFHHSERHSEVCREKNSRALQAHEAQDRFDGMKSIPMRNESCLIDCSDQNRFWQH